MYEKVDASWLRILMATIQGMHDTHALKMHKLKEN